MNIQAIKLYLIHVLMLGNWAAAFTAALLTIYPLTLGKASIGEIVTGFIVTFVLVATGGYLSHIKDVALKNALTAELQAIVQKVPIAMPGVWTAKQPQPIQLPNSTSQS